MPARIVPIETERGTRYMVVANGRTLCEETYRSVAILRAQLEFWLDLTEESAGIK